MITRAAELRLQWRSIKYHYYTMLIRNKTVNLYKQSIYIYLI